MLTLTKDIIGKKLPSFEFTVERGKIIEFCLACGEKNPIFLDKQAAIEAGFEDTPIPPTFQTVFNFWGYPKLMEDMRTLGIDTDRLLHLKEEYRYFASIYPNTKIKAEISVSDTKVGKMNTVTFRSTYKNSNDQLLLEAYMTIIIRPEGM